MEPVIFFDIEASSLSANSYPIEVGWAVACPDGSITSEAMLVTRQPAWDDWSQEAEAVHRITREMLDKQGFPVDVVVDRLDHVFAGGVVFSDYPSAEVMWTDRLYEVLGRKRRWRIGDSIPLIRATAATGGDNLWLSAHLERPRLHRADADARVLAEAFVELRRRRSNAGEIRTPEPLR